MEQKESSELRRNKLNMQKMIQKNIMASGHRIPKKKRAQIIVELAKKQHEKKLKASIDESKNHSQLPPKSVSFGPSSVYSYSSNRNNSFGKNEKLPNATKPEGSSLLKHEKTPGDAKRTTNPCSTARTHKLHTIDLSSSNTQVFENEGVVNQYKQRSKQPLKNTEKESLYSNQEKKIPTDIRRNVVEINGSNTLDLFSSSNQVIGIVNTVNQIKEHSKYPLKSIEKENLTVESSLKEDGKKVNTPKTKVSVGIKGKDKVCKSLDDKSILSSETRSNPEDSLILKTSPSHLSNETSNTFSLSLSESFPYLRSVCFSVEDLITSLDTTLDGKYVVTASSTGTIRIFDMQSSLPHERYGYLMGHLDELQPRQMEPSHVRVKISSDGHFCFVGARTSLRVMMAINLSHFHQSKDSQEEAMGHLPKHFHADSKLRGFADIQDTYISDKSSSIKIYHILCGLGVGTLKLWKFEVDVQSNVVEWKYCRQIDTNGNTVLWASFLAPPIDSDHIVFASRSVDRDLRIWNLSKNDKPTFLNIPNTKDTSICIGDFAYGNGMRVCLSGQNLGEFETLELVKNTSPYISKQRRSIDTLNLISATTNGDYICALSSFGVVYVYDQTKNNNSTVLQLVPIHQFELNTTHKIFFPFVHISKPQQDSIASSSPLIYLSPNCDSTDEGFIRIEFLSSLQENYIESNSNENGCKICGSKRDSHWDSNGSVSTSKLPVSNLKAPIVKSSEVSSTLENVSKPNQGATSSKKVQSIPSLSKVNSVRVDIPKKQVGNKTTGPSKVNEVVKEADKDAESDEEVWVDEKEKLIILQKQLQKTRKRLHQVTKEADRRLRAELQLRRSWKRQENEFKARIKEATEKYMKEVQHVEKSTKECESVRAEYDKFKQDMENQLQVVRASSEANKKRIDTAVLQLSNLKSGGKLGMNRLELFNISNILVEALHKNQLFLKNSIDNENECVICRDKKAVTAVYPCGHLCFCEEDADIYHVRSGAMKRLCPVCQREILSLLRVYQP